MTIPGIILILLLAQNAGPQQPAVPAAPASIEGAVMKAGTGELLSRATVTLTEIQNSASVAAQIQSLGVASNSAEYALLETTLNRISNVPGIAPQTMTTASDGKFLFENLKPGTYTLKAVSAGYAPAEYGQRSPDGRGMTITLKAAQKMQGVSLTMTPNGTITGRVVDANGDALNRALVQALKVVYQEKGRSLVSVQAVPTDDKGEYRLYWLPPGQYYISATPTDARMRTMAVTTPSTNNSSLSAASLGAAYAIDVIRDTGISPITGVVRGMKVTERTLPNGDVIDEADVQMFYPSALDISTATPIEVRPGGITGGIDITSRSSRVFRIRGVVISSTTGQPISTASMSLFQRNGPTIPQEIRVSQNSNSSGFEIAGVVPGSYNLLAIGADGAGKQVAGIVPIEIQDANRDNVLITATPSFTISGHVAAGGPISNAATPPTYFVQLDMQTPGMPGIGNVRSSIARNGNFVIAMAFPGDYRIIVTTPANTFPQSIRFGGQDVLRDGLHIDGPTNETVEVVVAPNAGRLEGTVSVDRQKLPNATVVLMPTSPLRAQTNLFKSVQTNAEGHFLFENISPGSYKVFGWDDVEDRAWFDAEFMRNFENRGREIVIPEGANESVEITAITR